MIHAIGEQLAAALVTAGIPFPVVDGPERRPTTTFGRERVVIERNGEDSFVSTHRPGLNPVTRLTRVVPCKITIYAQNPSKGSAEFEHFRRCEAVLDQVLIALYNITKGRQNILSLKSGKFVVPEEFKSGETMGGAVYELLFTVDRGVTTASWVGQAAPTATVGGSTIVNNTQVTVNGIGTPETAC